MPFLLDGPAVEVRDAGEHAVLQFDFRLHPLRGAHHVDQGLALLIVDLVQSFHWLEWKPARVEVPGRSNVNDTMLDSLFEAPIRFGAALRFQRRNSFNPILDTGLHPIGFARRGGVPPLKWSTNWESFIPISGGPRDGWKARQTQRERAAAAAG
jgi:hypothetical protein